jgi:hypothetical protein
MASVVEQLRAVNAGVSARWLIAFGAAAKAIVGVMEISAAAAASRGGQPLPLDVLEIAGRLVAPKKLGGARLL